jgi:FAD/FMN-containing dehydrogenase
MNSANPKSWGLLPKAQQQTHLFQNRQDSLPVSEQSLLPYGLGRSYGDSCLNDGNTLILTRGLDHWISFDRDTGLLECEAGASLAEILALAVPAGWFLPVTPGTQHVTVGGAIANDVHGKNHHRAGTFARHVLEFDLLRSDGSRRTCSRTENASWFRATAGGLGLTGLITRAVLQLRPIVSRSIDVEQIRMHNLSDFFSIADESDATHEYTVAWVDCLASGSETGRGIFIRGNHSQTPGPLTHSPKSPPSVPFHAPGALLNRYSVKVFNTLYAKKVRGERHHGQEDYRPFFYPLDSIGDWNRLYGKRGFYQHQCVVPRDGNAGPIHDILDRIGRSGQASFLAVLKVFGDQPSEGLISFPRPGVTLALDFPNRGQSTLDLMTELDGIVMQNGGALYPAKDARMRGDHFRTFTPALDHFTSFIDPAFSSSFWRRVTSTS